MWMIIGSLMILIVYVIWIIKLNKGIPESISQSYYLLSNPKKILFTLTIWEVAFLTIPTAMILDNWIILLAMIGILLVGAAPRVNEKFERLIHIGGTILCCLGSQLWILTSGYKITLLFWIIPLILIKNKNLVFWIEISCLLSYYTNLFLI